MSSLWPLLLPQIQDQPTQLGPWPEPCLENTGARGGADTAAPAQEPGSRQERVTLGGTMGQVCILQGHSLLPSSPPLSWGSPAPPTQPSGLTVLSLSSY